LLPLAKPAHAAAADSQGHGNFDRSKVESKSATTQAAAGLVVKDMRQNPNRVAQVFDTVAFENAEKFCDEHEKKPMDRVILYRVSQEVAGKKPIWDFGCGPGQTCKESFYMT
jgi:hypothetical protein